MRKLLLVFLLLTTPAFATTYYTAKLCSGGTSPPNCNNANNGTSRATAELTIAAGIAHLSAGDTLIIGDGTYDEFINGTIPGGSVGAHTTIRAENNRQATLFPASTGGIAVIWMDEDYITIDGLVVDATNVVNNGGYWLTNIGDNVSNVTIQNGIAKNGIIPGSSAGSYPNGVLLDQGTNLIVRNMEIFNFMGHGIYNPSSGALLENNYIHDWHSQGVVSGYGIQLNPAGATGVIVRNNTIANYDRGMFINGTGTKVYNNLVYGAIESGLYIRDGGTDVEVYFNDLVSNTGYGVQTNNNSAGSIIKNNIFYANGIGPIFDDAADSVCTYNLGVMGGESSSDSCSSTATASNPLFVNAPADFHLFDTSPALAAGVNGTGITIDKDGVTRPNPPSMGAYEVPSGVDPGSDLSENFESYTVTTSIDGKNGGTGWTQNWQLTAGDATIETASCLTGKAFRQSSTNLTGVRRFMAAKSGEFTIQLKMCLSVTNPNQYVGFSLNDQGGGYTIAVAFNGSNINYQTGATSGTLLSSFSANTPYIIRANYDTVNQIGKVRLSINDEAFGSWLDTGSAFTSINSLDFNNYATNAHSFEMDNISDDAGPPDLPPAPVSPIGTRTKIRMR